jgi:outer membrane protein assembly factor BamB
MHAISRSQNLPDRSISEPRRFAPWLKGLGSTWVILTFLLDLRAGDWLQYRGPNHDGISQETIRTNWSETPPRVVWKIPLEPALSSFSVSGDKAFTQVRRRVSGQDQEVCVALNTATGQEIWAVPLGIADYPNGGVGTDDGPRSTPSVEGNRVFVLTSYLRLACLDSSDGHLVWSKDLAVPAQVVSWQNAASPLIENGLIFLNSNPSTNGIIALRLADGSEAWRGANDAMTQASPIAATAAGVRQVIFFARSGLVSVDPSSGSVLWRYSMPFSTSTAASPVAVDDAVYCSAAYGVGAGTVGITGSGASLRASELWRTPGGNMNHWATPVHYGGYLFGVYGQSTTTLRCVELSTGTEMWRQAGVGEGGVLGVAGLVLVLTENGSLILVNPDPGSYAEVDRYRALDGSSSSIPGLAVKCWNVPAISDGRIYVRSTTEAVCLDVTPTVPPRLELSGTLTSDGQTFRLFVGNQDSSPLDTNRAARLDVLTSTNLALGPDGWNKILEPVVLTNGRLLVEDPQKTATPRRYFRVEERP